MSKSDKIFNIPFVGLKIGKHDFDYEIDDSFFADLEYSLVKKGAIKAKLQLDKRETMLIAQFWIEGTVFVACDRCTAPMEINIKGDYKLIYKFGLEEAEDETLVVIHPDAYQINVKDPIYELIIISLPNRTIHKEGECDEEMWNLVKQYTINAEDEDEDSWEEDEEWDEDEDDDDWEDDDEEDDKEDPWSILKDLN